MSSLAPAPDHGALMDHVYRGQRHIYDATRKYFLFGRDRLIARLDCAPGMTLLEIGCGTGRNLAAIRRRFPQIEGFGLDISNEMLKSARTRLGSRITLGRGDATGFDAPILLGRAAFDRIVMSYTLSMIPDWRAAMRQAAGLLAPGGSLHVVDFGDASGLPPLLRRALAGWLARFHVAPRLDLADVAQQLAAERGWRCQVHAGPLGYYRQVTIERLA